MNRFDPYHTWLGIPHEEQPPTHYRLLGIQLFESDRDVIRNAADRRMTHLKTFSAGEHSRLSQELLGEVSAAQACLLDVEKKRAYDDRLRHRGESNGTTCSRPISFPLRVRLQPQNVFPPAAAEESTTGSDETALAEPSPSPEHTKRLRGRREWGAAIFVTLLLFLALAAGTFPLLFHVFLRMFTSTLAQPH